MNISDILLEESLLLESGVRIPEGTKSAKILHHDDFDGIMSAVSMGLQLKKQGITNITTDILHDGDSGVDQVAKLGKRKGQMLVVVDFDRFKDAAKELAKSNVDVQTDHHEKNDPDEMNKGGKSVKPEFGSDVMHISTKKAQGFITGSDLAIMNGIDSAKFGKNLSTNIYLQRELKKNDGPQNKKMRLAIITSSLVGQLVRSKASVNPGAVKSIINSLMKSPTVLNFYSTVKKHIKLQKEQVALLSAYEGKKSGDVDWAAIETYNNKVSPEMRIGKDRMGQVKKTKDQGRKEAASEEELGKRNAEKQAGRDLEVDEKGNKSLKSKDAGDADLPPWTAKDKFNPISSARKSMLWRDAELEAEKEHMAIVKGYKKAPKDYMGGQVYWNKLSKDRQKSLIVPIWKEKMNAEQKDTPKILRKTENVSQQSDFKGNRYLAYEDPKIVANIRDFWKFWQMSMRPDYYDKLKDAAKKYGQKFDPEEIDLVTLGKEAMVKAKKKFFTVEELRKRGFDNPEAVLKILNKQFDVAHAKSGGHKAITNIDLNPIYGETATKYDAAAKKAKALGAKSNNPKLKEIEKKMAAKAKLFNTLLRQFKEEMQTELTNMVQAKVDNTKGKLLKTMKDSGVKPKSSLKDNIKANAGDTKPLTRQEKLAKIKDPADRKHVEHYLSGRGAKSKMERENMIRIGQRMLDGKASLPSQTKSKYGK